MTVDCHRRIEKAVLLGDFHTDLLDGTGRARDTLQLEMESFSVGFGCLLCQSAGASSSRRPSNFVGLETNKSRPKEIIDVFGTDRQDRLSQWA